MGGVRIIAKRTLREYWETHEDAKDSLESWYTVALAADWENPQELKSQIGTASILKGSRVVFNIKGNDYRLVVKINFAYRVVYIRFIGTHEEYDNINVEEV